MTHNDTALNQEQKINNFKKIVTQVIIDYSLPLDSDELRTWRNSNNKELTEWIEKTFLIKAFTIKTTHLKEQVPNWHEDLIQEMERGEKSDRIKEIIEHWKTRAERAEEDAQIHYDFIGTLEKLNGKVRDELHEEIRENLELLEKTKSSLEEQKVKVEELERGKEVDAEALQEIREKFEEQKKISEELQRQIYLDQKPLPKIPSKFKLFKQKTQTKFKQFQQVVKKTKVQTQEFIARIEVKVK